MNDVVRVIGPVKRIWRGWERRDRIRVNGAILNGYVSVRKQNGIRTETTAFGQIEVEGYQWIWLARKNNREDVVVESEPQVTEIVKAKPEPKPVKAKKEKKLTKLEILEKVQKGEINSEDAVKLLTEAA